MRESGDLRGLQLALVVYVLVLALKLAVYFATGVMALFAEAMHTLSDIFVSGFLLLAALWSRREPDEAYAFGYGRAQNVGALVAATLFISFTSLRLYEEALPRLFQPAEASYQNLPLALGVLVASMLLAGAPLLKLFLQKQRGAAAKAQLMESINDELGLLAALLGTLFVLAGEPIADPIASIVVATIIAVNAVGLFRENAAYLMGRSPGPEFKARVVELARSVPGVLGVHELRAEYVGPDTVHAGLHVEVAPGLSVEEAESIAEQVQAQVHRVTGCRHCVVHVEPAKSDRAAPEASG